MCFSSSVEHSGHKLALKYRRIAETGLGLNRVSKVSVLDWENDLSQSLFKQFQLPIADTTSRLGHFLANLFPRLQHCQCFYHPTPPPPLFLQQFLLILLIHFYFSFFCFFAFETSECSTTQLGCCFFLFLFFWWVFLSNSLTCTRTSKKKEQNLHYSHY